MDPPSVPGQPTSSAPAALVRDDLPPIGRLDERVVPKLYSIEWTLEETGFVGALDIQLEVKGLSNTIWLHAAGLVVERATITQNRVASNATVIQDTRDDHIEGQSDLVGLRRPEVLQLGPATLHLDFRGEYAKGVGLIRPNQDDPLIFTDLEPNDARRALPCFDDPKFKVPFSVRLNVPSDRKVASNYPIAKEEPLANGRRRVTFQTTRPIPTYQIAIAAGQWEEVTAKYKDIPLRVLTPVGLSNQGKLALSWMPRILAKLETYLDEPLPYPKLDVLAIPTLPGNTGGMENPGLITLRRDILLMDESSQGTRREHAAEAMSHELAHMWIGDLVTLNNWGELWIQEGGASWLGMKLAKEIGELPAQGGFSLAGLLNREGKAPRASIAAAIEQPEDAAAMFRMETYAGGAAVYATLESFVGPNAFRSALVRWIDAHRDGTTTGADLVKELAAGANGVALRTSVEGMVSSRSTPRVTADLRCGPSPTVVLTTDATFPVPVCVAVDDCIGSAELDCRACALVSGPTAVSIPRCPAAVQLNPGASALYHAGWGKGSLAPLLSSAAKMSSDDMEYLTSELSRDLDSMPVSERARAAAYIALRSDYPTRQRRAIDTLEVLSRVAPDAEARAKLVTVVGEIVSKQPPVFVGPGRWSSRTAGLARWLAQRGDAALQAQAKAVETKDSILLGFAWPAYAGVADAATTKKWRGLALKEKDSLGDVAAAALGWVQGASEREKLKTLLLDRALTDARASLLLESVFTNPAWEKDRGALLSLRPSVVASSERILSLLCDVGELERIGKEAKIPAEVVFRARVRVEECGRLRQDWNDQLALPAGSPLPTR